MTSSDSNDPDHPYLLRSGSSFRPLELLKQEF